MIERSNLKIVDYTICDDEDDGEEQFADSRIYNV